MILLLVLLLAGLFLILAKPVFDIDLRVFQNTKTANSIALFTQVRDVMAINTVEVVYRTVFPFDFVPQDMDWKLFLAQVQEGRALSIQEKEYLKTYQFCLEIGIDLVKKRREFVVVTSIIKGGFDLSEYSVLNTHMQVDNKNGAISVKIPATVVTDVIIEDATTEDYSYPDMAIDPEGWRLLIAFVEKRVQKQVTDEGVLEVARQNGLSFITLLLHEAGYSDVSFFE